MITLYMDNFRGFKDTYLPLKDVNFFVGENSTGKTSVMGLIQILQSRTFWENLDFRDDSKVIDLGSAEEIGDPTKVVRIGLHDSQVGSINLMHGHRVMQREYTSILLGLDVQSNGSFRIKDLHFRTNLIEASIISFNENYIYKIQNATFNNINELAKDIFERWITQINEFQSNYRITNGFKELDFFKQLGDTEAIRRFKQGAFTEIMSYLAMNSVWKKDEISSNTENNGLLPGQIYPVFFPDRVLFSPIRTKPEPIYGRVVSGFSAFGEHTPNLLKQLHESGEYSKLFSQLEEFGQNSGLFDGITIQKISSNNFQIHIHIGNQKRLITNVGYGVSQVLPLVVETLFREEGIWFLLQQPEVHLHPKAQSAFGEFIFNQASEFDKKFIIETHSDFLVDRYRLTMRKSEKKVETQVVYFEHTENGNSIHLLTIDEEGRYPEEQPNGFRDFFINEAIAMMEV